MAVKFEFDKRTKILLGVVALAVIGALAWFLHFGEEPAPPPPPVAAAKPPAKPAPVAVTPVAVAPAKPAGETPKPAAEAPKPVAESPNPAAAPVEKTAAAPQPSRKSRRHEDARQCLNEPGNAAIIKCAEAYL